VLYSVPRHKDVLGSGSIAPRILNLGTRWRWVVRDTSRPLYRRYSLDRKLGGPQNRSRRSGEEWIPASARNRTPVLQPVA